MYVLAFACACMQSWMFICLHVCVWFIVQLVHISPNSFSHHSVEYLVLCKHSEIKRYLEGKKVHWNYMNHWNLLVLQFTLVSKYMYALYFFVKTESACGRVCACTFTGVDACQHVRTQMDRCQFGFFVELFSPGEDYTGGSGIFGEFKFVLTPLSLTASLTMPEVWLVSPPRQLAACHDPERPEQCRNFSNGHSDIGSIFSGQKNFSFQA